MRHFQALWYREWLEMIRDPKRIVLLILFLFFGLLSPLTAKLIPDLLKLMTASSGMGGIQITIPIPDVYSAYEQFLKNLTQLVLFSVVLVFMGGVSQEKQEGSAALVMTKGVSRPLYLLVRFTAMMAVVSVSFWLSSGVFLLYAQFLFGNAIVPGAWTALCLLWLYLVFAGAVTLLASTLSRTPTMSALLAFGLLFVLMVSGSLPFFRDWSPTLLSGLPTRALSGMLTPADILRPLVTGLVSILSCWGIASLVMIRQEL